MRFSFSPSISFRGAFTREGPCHAISDDAAAAAAAATQITIYRQIDTQQRLSHTTLCECIFFFVCAQEIGSCTCVDYLIDRYAHVTFKRETERDEKQIKLLRSISYVQKIFKRHLKQLLLTHQNQTQGKSVGRVNIGAKRLDGVVK